MSPQAGPDTPLEHHINEFLKELGQANRSAHTLRAYRGDLQEFEGEMLEDLTPAALRQHFVRLSHLSPATRARKQAAMSAFCRWLVLHDLLPSNPMDRLERVKLEAPLPRSISRPQFRQILDRVESPRDRLLFKLMFETGLRVSEALGLHVEDLDLRKDNEHVAVQGKGGKRRTVLLDDPMVVRDLRSHLKRTGYQHGFLFRAEKGGTGGQLRYQTIQEKWAGYCKDAGVSRTIHQLRHAHGTELINDGVSLETIRKRLGHRHIQTTLRYAEKSDEAAELELRTRRRNILRR